MSNAEEFPVLTRSRRIPAVVLQFLETIRTGGSDRIGISSRLSAQLDEVTLQTLPEIVEGALGPDHPEFAKVLHRLAVLYHSRDNTEKAEFLYRRALDTAARAFPEPSEEWGLMMNNLGRLLHDNHQLGEAEQLYCQCLETLEKALGPEHRKLATPMSNLAKLYADQGKMDLAEKSYRDSIRVLEKAHGANHPKVAKAKERLARHRRSII
jgi:Tfp pilus assembly protein PilF